MGTWLHLSANEELAPSSGLRHSCGRALTASKHCASSHLLCGNSSPKKHTATAVREPLSWLWLQTRTSSPCVTPYGLIFCACCDLPWAGPTTTMPGASFSTLKQRCRQPPATTDSKIHTPKCALREHLSDKMHTSSKSYPKVILICVITTRLQ